MSEYAQAVLAAVKTPLVLRDERLVKRHEALISFYQATGRTPQEAAAAIERKERDAFYE